MRANGVEVSRVGALRLYWCHYVGMGDSHKMKRLAHLLGIRDPDELVGKVARLHDYCIEEAPDGELGHMGAHDLEMRCCWLGNEGAFFDALEKVGWVVVREDGTAFVKGWMEHSGKLHQSRQRDAARKAASRAAAKQETPVAAEASEGCPPDICGRPAAALTLSLSSTQLDGSSYEGSSNARSASEPDHDAPTTVQAEHIPPAQPPPAPPPDSPAREQEKQSSTSTNLACIASAFPRDGAVSVDTARQMFRHYCKGNYPLQSADTLPYTHDNEVEKTIRRLDEGQLRAEDIHTCMWKWQTWASTKRVPPPLSHRTLAQMLLDAIHERQRAASLAAASGHDMNPQTPHGAVNSAIAGMGGRVLLTPKEQANQRSTMAAISRAQTREADFERLFGKKS